ncbi:MAG TPA: hypothetical protein PLD41_16210, partial [Casimicrobium huifangae]|nr:hypothetical protein [Casimicrobium huifangae]
AACARYATRSLASPPIIDKPIINTSNTAASETAFTSNENRRIVALHSLETERNISNECAQKMKSVKSV